MKETVLILGARGRFGLAAARAFCDAGWHVVCQIRPGAGLPAGMADDARLRWVGIDLHDVRAVTAAANGAAVVVHALNPAYTNKAWQSQVLPAMDSAIAIARALHATLMLPGNVYNFGANMPGVLREDTQQTARTVKGQIRVAMEQRLQRVAKGDAGAVRGVVIRAGDFFGSGRGTWFDTTLAKNVGKGVFTYPGPREVATPWAYLPDLARTFVAVAAQRERLQPFEVFHFAGHQITGQQWVDALAQVARAQGWVKPGGDIKFSALPWPFIRLGALVNPTWRALMEMRYLWETPHALDNTKLTTLIGPEPHTALAQATRLALVDLGLMHPVDKSAPALPRQATAFDEAGASKFSPVQR
jgi:nucleoside-diphosphate-sugar epimerase